MQKRTVLTVAAVAACAFAAGAFAADSVAWLGAAPSHRTIERYDMSLGVTAGQSPRLPRRLEEERKAFVVPSHYGSLVTITGDSQAAVFWYRSDDGVVRNAVLTAPAATPYRLQQAGSSRLESDQREK